MLFTRLRLACTVWLLITSSASFNESFWKKAEDEVSWSYVEYGASASGGEEIKGVGKHKRQRRMEAEKGEKLLGDMQIRCFRGLSQSQQTAEENSQPPRSLQSGGGSSPFRPLRVDAVTDALASALAGDASLRSYLIDDVIPSALFWIQTALAVKPVEGNLSFDRLCDFYWTNDQTQEKRCAQVSSTYRSCGKAEIPESHFRDQLVCSPRPTDCTTARGGQGVWNADFAVYISASAVGESDADVCGGQALGLGVTCKRDQLDRPVAGNVHVCASRFRERGLDFRGDVGFFVHEILHALGFSWQSLSLFREPSGEPRQTRNPDGSPVSSEPASFTVRTSWEGGKSVSRVVTPTVAEAAQEHYGCFSIEGMSLEDEGGETSERNHWERRVALNEGMTGVLGTRPVFSALTLAFMHDSGWYKANFPAAMDFPWGKAFVLSGSGVTGCDVLSGASRCLTPASSNPRPLHPSLFCNEDGNGIPQTSCTQDLSSPGICQVGDSPSSLPASEQYFQGRPRFGGSSPFMNHCPIVEGASTTECENVSNFNPSRAWRGETFGPSSVCVKTTLLEPAYVFQEGEPAAGRCHRVVCTPEQFGSGRDRLDFSGLSIAVEARTMNRISVISCGRGDEGKSFSVVGLNGEIQCPPLQAACFHFPCDNGGVYRHHKCVCAPGFFGTFCELKDSEVNRRNVPNRFFYPGLRDATLIPGNRYSFEASVRGPVKEFRLVSCLPPGLSLNKQTGAIEGTPSTNTLLGCLPYTVAAVGFNGGEERVVVYLRIQRAASTSFSFASDLCSEVILGNAFGSLPTTDTRADSTDCVSSSASLFESLRTLPGLSERTALPSEAGAPAPPSEEGPRSGPSEDSPSSSPPRGETSPEQPSSTTPLPERGTPEDPGQAATRVILPCDTPVSSSPPSPDLPKCPEDPMRYFRPRDPAVGGGIESKRPSAYTKGSVDRTWAFWPWVVDAT
uniref:EGF-like domain-containing protein n=1 Tax=Chromera velia CCMP2878 TaxID=1169474 RepID=A0A0G4G597_9ALVE|eukprot:Cvel_20249.t1-p1 / transcript=Cvel_20249.t1 / gene=Cvel_20249 / organism=Chromera_velia_CCMP2878 / gene_product=Leishmanolysin-like peptidase, putative / transcript_product=Leishmanolysin-like peptidase, putative / location=Cvel_scaffold1805:11495-16710(-) / protein_length=959 / sequence_SO=supercontig / SO=protein_coding / is_pseudo=false